MKLYLNAIKFKYTKRNNLIYSFKSKMYLYILLLAFFKTLKRRNQLYILYHKYFPLRNKNAPTLRGAQSPKPKSA